MKPTIALIIPLGAAPGTPDHTLPGVDWPVDPGYGVGAEHPDQGGPSPGRPSTGPVRPGWPGRPGHALPRPGRPVDPGYGIDEGAGPDQGLPPEVAPPIFLPVPPPTVGGGPIVPPSVWPPAGSVQPPMVMPPVGIWPPPKPAQGYIVVYLPGYGLTYVKLGVSVGGGPAPTPPPTPAPKS